MADDREPDELVPGPEIPAPLGEPAQRLLPYAKAVVLERGVYLKKIYYDLWQFRGKGSEPVARLSEILGQLDLAVVRVTFESRSSQSRHFLAPRTAGRLVLEMQVQALRNGPLFVDNEFARSVRNIAYIAEASVYHCQQLVGQYLEVLDTNTHHGQKLDLFSDDFISTGAVSPYFEVEALITTVVRAYNTIRFPLWSAFGTGGTPPSNFERVAEKLRVPDALHAVLPPAVETYKETKEYRDCIQHYAHFGARLPFARVQLRNGLAWSVLALLPDNPETKAYDKFAYTKQIDAMSYGWSITERLLNDLTVLISAFPARGP